MLALLTIVAFVMGFHFETIHGLDDVSRHAAKTLSAIPGKTRRSEIKTSISTTPTYLAPGLVSVEISFGHGAYMSGYTQYYLRFFGSTIRLPFTRDIWRS